MRLLVLAAILVGTPLVNGCSGSNTAAGSNGGSGGAAGSGQSGDASGAAGSGSPAKAGYIGVGSQSTAVAAVFANALRAGFYDGPGNSYSKGCQRRVIGACSVLICDFTNGGDQRLPTGAAESAGTIHIAGTTPSFSLEYDAGSLQYGAVPAVPNDQPLFAAGATVTFSAAGAAVPAFAESIVAPTPLTVTSPAPTSDALAIDTNRDLVFDWSGSSAGRLAFNVRTSTTSFNATVASSFVSCQFEASALTGTIPKTLLQQLTKTDYSTTATLTTDLSNTTEVAAGDHEVHLAVGSVATVADGKTPYMAGHVTLF